jgi:GDPmannose 4,6-dehydratase
VFLAGSCHQFGDAPGPQSEATPFSPTNLYGITKTAATHLGRYYRERHGMHVSTGILFNHESPRRRLDFITAQIAKGAVECLRGNQKELVVGDLNAKVDWGFAGDYARAMRMMVAADKPDDYVISSGELHTVGEFVTEAFDYARLKLDGPYHNFVREDPSTYRPVSKTTYFGDNAKIRNRLDWNPQVGFKQLVHMMVDHYLTTV